MKHFASQNMKQSAHELSMRRKACFIAVGDFIFHAPQVRFISKNKSRSNDLLLFLGPTLKMEPVGKRGICCFAI